MAAPTRRLGPPRAVRMMMMMRRMMTTMMTAWSGWQTPLVGGLEVA